MQARTTWVNVVEEVSMFGSKKTKVVQDRKVICEHCGLDCQDKESLQRHLDWAHRDLNAPVKP
jgi:hypothetical protein